MQSVCFMIMALKCNATVIGGQFILPNELNVIVQNNGSGNLLITDRENKTMLTIISCDTSFHKQRLLLDECQRPIATLRAKNVTRHTRWNVFRGLYKDNSDIIFSATTNDKIPNYTSVNVSLANKMSPSDDCDFQIHGSWANKDYYIYKRDSSTTIAQMHHEQSPEKFMEPSQKKFMVKINPNVDYAFVVALIAIVDAIEIPSTTKVVAGHVATQLAYGVAGAVAQFFIEAILS